MKLYFPLLLLFLLTACKSTEPSEPKITSLTSLLNHPLFELQPVPTEQAIFKLPASETDAF
uniref:hypothetical protein n=1 Tax=Salmonella sp. ZJHZ20_0198 TaxID=3159597 RepID=UPI00397D4679